MNIVAPLLNKDFMKYLCYTSNLHLPGVQKHLRGRSK